MAGIPPMRRALAMAARTAPVQVAELSYPTDEQSATKSGAGATFAAGSADGLPRGAGEAGGGAAGGGDGPTPGRVAGGAEVGDTATVGGATVVEGSGAEVGAGAARA
jgi:hypothetical protein